MVRRWQIPLLASVIMLTPQSLLACPVCFGASDAPMARGVNMAILLLLGITGMVLSGFVALILAIRGRARRHAAEMERSQVS